MTVNTILYYKIMLETAIQKKLIIEYAQIIFQKSSKGTFNFPYQQIILCLETERYFAVNSLNFLM